MFSLYIIPQEFMIAINFHSPPDKSKKTDSQFFLFDTYWEKIVKYVMIHIGYNQKVIRYYCLEWV